MSTASFHEMNNVKAFIHVCGKQNKVSSESSLSAALLALGGPSLCKMLIRGRVFEVKQTQVVSWLFCDCIKATLIEDRSQESYSMCVVYIVLVLHFLPSFVMPISFNQQDATH